MYAIVPTVSNRCTSVDLLKTPDEKKFKICLLYKKYYKYNILISYSFQIIPNKRSIYFCGYLKFSVLVFRTVIFAMEGVGVVMPVENEMKKPNHFLGCPSVLLVAMSCIVFLYSTLGLFGYFKFGDTLKGSITLNLPIEHWLVFTNILLRIVYLVDFRSQFVIPSRSMSVSESHKSNSSPLMRVN